MIAPGGALERPAEEDAYAAPWMPFSQASPRPGIHPVSDLLRRACGGKDGAPVGARHFEPRGYVAGMVGARLDAEVEVGTDHGAEKFNRAFFHGGGRRAEPSGETAVETMLGAGSATIFVEQHGVGLREAD